MADSYWVTRIAVPPTLSDINQYRDIRLASIRTDPICFLSTYERELSLTEEQWRARLDSDEKATFTARTISDEHDGDERWVGTVTVLGPPVLKQSMSEFPEEMRSGERQLIYLVVGMWIHPEHRQKCLGKQLIEACLEWAQRRTADGVDGKGEGSPWAVLQVNANNVAGRKLYEATGFVVFKDKNGSVTSTTTEKGEELWMKRVLEEPEEK